MKRENIRYIEHKVGNKRRNKSQRQNANVVLAIYS